LFGVIDEAKRSSQVNRVLGARFGVEGLIENNLVDLNSLSATQLSQLRTSPGAALGTTRVKPSDTELEQITDLLREQNVRWLLMIGGNGSLRGAEAIGLAADRAGLDVCVVGVPKTIDNDIAQTDRCPGFASAARYVAQSVRDLGMDVRTLPQPVSIFETMGRSVGWLAGASVLGRIDPSHAPHLVYLPERVFDVQSFLRDIEETVASHGWAVAVVTEGIRKVDGSAVFEVEHDAQRDSLGRAVMGGVAAFLASQVASQLNLRCRWEQPGLCGRTSMLHVAAQDLIDAEFVGRSGVRAAIEGVCNHVHMVALNPLSGDSTEPTCRLVPMARLPRHRAVPEDWLGESPRSPVAAPFMKYAGRLVGKLVEYPVPIGEIAAPLVAKELSR
jgi:6-phosphofructokinase 1